jgi:signal transduction histidine kinase
MDRSETVAAPDRAVVTSFEARGARSAFLAEVSELLAASLDVDTTLMSIARLSVSHVADWCLIDLVDERGEVRRVAVAHADATKAPVADVIRRYPPKSNPGNPAARTLRTGQSLFERDLTDDLLREWAVDAPHFAAMRAIGACAAITVPLRARERTLGVVTFIVAKAGRTLGPDELATAEELARRASLAVDNALLVAAERRAREMAERAMLRTARLQALTTALSQATTRETIAEIVVTEAQGALAASAGAVVLRSEEGGIDVLAARGFDRDVVDAWRRARNGEPLALPDALRDVTRVVPLLVDGRALGGLVIALRDLRGGDDDQAIIETLAAVCAQALERARLLDAERRARDSLRFLAEASAALASSLEYETALASVARLAVPHFADGCVLDVLDPSGTIARVAAASFEGEATLCERALLGGESFVLRDAPPGASYASLLVVPIVVRGHIFGALGFVMTSSRRAYTTCDLPLAEDLARRAALAIDNALRYREAQAASRARDDLLAVVSHDLRTPLSVISASAGILKRSPPSEPPVPERTRRSAETILRAVGRMDSLIADLLDVSLIEAQRLRVEPAPCDVALLVHEAAEMLRPLAAQKGQMLAIDIPGGLPLVACDRNRTLQVFANLGGNAIKYTGEGGTITIRAEMSDGGDLVFCVSDTGPGIPPDEREHVFDRYWRARSTTRDGAGLGLSIAKAIVEAHGGRVWLESEVGVGSTFSFTLLVA